MGVIYEEILQTSIRFPDKIAVIASETESLTYSELLFRVNKRANRLLKLLSFKGDANCCVATLYKDECEQLITVLALNACNLFISPLNRELTEGQVKLAVESVNAKYLLHDFSEKIDCSNVQAIQCQVHDDLSFSEILEFKGESKNYRHFLVTLSSGSTGQPKPIIFSEKTKIMRFQHARDTYNLGGDDIVLCASPFHHSLGQRLTFLPLLLGGTLVFLKKFSKDSWFKKVKQSKVTFTIAVSSHINSLRNDLFEFMSRGCNLRGLVSSSAFIDHATKKNIFSIPNFSFYEMYGASEVGTATNLTKNDPEKKWGSVGRACNGINIKIVDDKKREVKSPLTVGEIKISSYTVSEGYLNKEALNKEAFKDGYFFTGDLGYLDEDGYLYFVDRKKDIIISGGSNIYPSDVEEVIKGLDGVADCCLIGLEDEYLVEVPVAFIIPLGSIAELEKKIRSQVRKKLSPFQRPIGYSFCDAFPLGGTGKLDKKALREEAKQKFSSITKKYLAMKK
jgi:long-chain acyl-CoA synthetase